MDIRRDDRPFGGPAPPAAIFYYTRGRRGEHPQAASGWISWDPAGGRIQRLQRPVLRGATTDPVGGELLEQGFLTGWPRIVAVAAPVPSGDRTGGSWWRTMRAKTAFTWRMPADRRRVPAGSLSGARGALSSRHPTSRREEPARPARRHSPGLERPAPGRHRLVVDRRRWLPAAVRDDRRDGERNRLPLPRRGFGRWA
jgi:hypothetical protein